MYTPVSVNVQYIKKQGIMPFTPGFCSNDASMHFQSPHHYVRSCFSETSPDLTTRPTFSDGGYLFGIIVTNPSLEDCRMPWCAFFFALLVLNSFIGPLGIMLRVNLGLAQC